MAKVVGPLMSLEARGKIGNALVAFVWKGRNVMRAWTIPSNPRAQEQKFIRQKLAAIGKNTAKIKHVQSDLLSGSAMMQLIAAKTPATQIWNAYFCKSALDDLKTEAAFIAFWSDMTNEGLTTGWEAVASLLGFATLTGAAFATAIPPSIQLAMGAYAAYKLELSGTTSLYSAHPTNWTDAQITDFGTDYFTDT